jgi:2-methylisocitrate lyase-like PEP mutase family enzyme
MSANELVLSRRTEVTEERLRTHWHWGDRFAHMNDEREDAEAFAAAGADCLFAPGVRDPREIRAMVEAVAPKPVNVLVSSPSPSMNLGSLSALGVRRISVGAALARVAWGAFMKASQSIAETGNFDALESAARFDELNAIFHERT